MGHFYTNITLKGVEPALVAVQLHEWRRYAIITPRIGDYVVVFDLESERQDGTVRRLAQDLSKAFRCVAFAITNHDDSVLYGSLWRNDENLDDYNSKPNYFHGRPGAPPTGGNAAAICRAFGCPAAEPQLSGILRRSTDEDYVFEIDRHRDIVSTLGLPIVAVGAGVEYLIAGKGPAGADLDTCLIVFVPEGN